MLIRHNIAVCRDDKTAACRRILLRAVLSEHIGGRLRSDSIDTDYRLRNDGRYRFYRGLVISVVDRNALTARRFIGRLCCQIAGPEQDKKHDSCSDKTANNAADYSGSDTVFLLTA